MNRNKSICKLANLSTFNLLASSSSCYASIMKGKVNPFTIISKKEMTKIVKTLLKIAGCVIELAALERGTFPTHFFSVNFQSNCSFE